MAWSFKEIIDSRPKLDGLLTKLNLPINDGDWIHQAFIMLDSFEKIRVTGDLKKIREYHAAFAGQGEIAVALHDLCMLTDILSDNLEAEDPTILRMKFQRVMQLTPFTGEDVRINEPRNTLFELMFFRRLRYGGLTAHLGHPNPDIIVEGKSDHRYFVECKRVFSDNDRALRNNLQDAIAQLITALENPSDFGIVALAVDRHFTAGQRGLVASSEAIAKEHLASSLKKFYIAKKHILEGNIRTYPRIVGIMLFVHASGKSETEERLFTGSQVTAVQVNLNDYFLSDFGPLSDNPLERI